MLALRVAEARSDRRRVSVRDRRAAIVREEGVSGHLLRLLTRLPEQFAWILHAAWRAAFAPALSAVAVGPPRLSRPSTRGQACDQCQLPVDRGRQAARVRPPRLGSSCDTRRGVARTREVRTRADLRPVRGVPESSELAVGGGDPLPEVGRRSAHEHMVVDRGAFSPAGAAGGGVFDEGVVIGRPRLLAGRVVEVGLIVAGERFRRSAICAIESSSASRK